MRKQSILNIVIVLALVLFSSVVLAQEDVRVTATELEIEEGLNLQAVSELFKDAENLEEFEKSLNDPQVGINNLDLDNDGEVDFIRVVEEVAEDAHVIILQVPMGKDDYQDVATIEVEKSDGEDYNFLVHGNEDLYGSNYYLAPTVVHVRTWPIILWLYRPAYRPYQSIYRFGYYPRWWKPYRRVTINVYRPRVTRYTGRKHFVVARTSRVHTVRRVRYTPRSSVKVTRVRKVGPGVRRVEKKPVRVTRPRPARRKPVVKKKK